jgi:hypothetical protein
MQHDNLLNCIFATSAAYLEGSGDSLWPREIVQRARRIYFVLALKTQKDAVSALSSDNLFPILLSSLLLCICSFTTLAERQFEPYTTPVEWLELANKTRSVIQEAIDLARGGPLADFVSMLTEVPNTAKLVDYFLDLPEAFQDMAQAVLTTYMNDLATKEVFESTIAYLGAMQSAIDAKEPLWKIGRRVQAFPIVIPMRFIELLVALEPQALVVFSYFFAIVAQVEEEVWWCARDKPRGERTAVREIRAINSMLSKEWKAYLLWPLELVELC